MNEKRKIALSEAFLEGKHLFECPFINTISNEKFQAPTSSENVLKTSLVRYLEEIDANCELAHQQYIAIKLSTLKKILKKHHRLDLLDKKIIEEKGAYLRPDFLCSKYGFAIE